MARKSKRPRRVYRPASSAVPPSSAASGAPARPAQSPRRRARGGSAFPLLPASLIGLSLGFLIIAAFVLLDTKPGRAELATPVADYPAENDDGSLGTLAATLTIEEWADFQCPACRRLTETIEPRLIETYVKTGTVRFVFHDFAFLGARRASQSAPDESIEAATAARCAGEQDRFWPYHGYLFANQGGIENGGTFNEALFDEIAGAIGLDVASFDACLAGREARAAIIAETSEAAQAGIDSTPTLSVGDERFQGVPSWDDLWAAIEAELAAQ